MRARIEHPPATVEERADARDMIRTWLYPDRCAGSPLTEIIACRDVFGTWIARSVAFGWPLRPSDLYGFAVLDRLLHIKTLPMARDLAAKAAAKAAETMS